MHTCRYRSSFRRLIFFVSIFLGALHSEAAIVIDDFSVGPISVSRTGAIAATAAQTGLDPSHVIGGGRDISVGEFGSPTQTLTIDTLAGELQAVATNSAGYFTIRYGSAAQPLNLNVTAGSGGAFLVEALGPPSAIGYLPIIRLYSAHGDGYADPDDPSLTMTALPTGGTAIRIPFEDIVDFPAGSLDVTKITTIEIDYGRSFGNLRLSSVSIIPEPASLALMGIGALIVWRRSRQ